MLALALRLAALLKSSPSIVDMLHQDTMTMQAFASGTAGRGSAPLLPVATCRIDVPGSIGVRARKVTVSSETMAIRMGEGSVTDRGNCYSD